MKQFGKLLSYLGIAFLTLSISILLILLVGSSVTQAFSSFLSGIFGSFYSVSEVMVKATPLILTGLGVAVGSRSGFINIGAEGQLYMGAIAVTFIAFWLNDLPAIVMIPLVILGGFVFGGIWSVIPGFLKVRFGISEVITTLMFNYIALSIVGILVRTWLKDPASSLPMSAFLPDGATLPTLISTTRLHAGLLVALISVVLVWLVVWKTPTGYEMRAVGLNPRASKCSGISVYKNIILSSLISGGLAGIAGVCEVSGLHHKLLEGISPGYGYIAIIVALLGKNHPVGVVISALGIAALQVGSLGMQRMAGVPTSISSIIMGVVVLLILARKSLFRRLLTDE
ncbi:ABC transporter permease [Desulfosporosinus sp. HMP52]|uniref:ABC transporter permease n=1 Tax=Desulfosporosinus sp. HMP52 TaxID=1487923 RepID=UPI00051FCDCE|nr:ABC transporter permease [Desulfosporosinus sp. HMP52]KGK92067.1 ABC transporter permease [Desulfosporosinus sp. HMP52]